MIAINPAAQVDAPRRTPMDKKAKTPKKQKTAKPKTAPAK